MTIMSYIKRLCCLTAMLAGFGMAGAAEADSVAPLRPVVSIFSAEIGGAHMLDTYLSPLRYNGLHLGLAWEHIQATGFAPERWIRRLELSADYNRTHNPAGNHRNHSLQAQAQWSLLRRWRVAAPTADLQLMAGGETTLRGGMLYSGHNSNNVVSARAHWSIGAAAMAVYNTRLGRLPVTLSYRLSLPVAGVFYSPEYGESYYEMYVGNRGGLAHFGWWGNRFDMENLLAVDLHLGATVLRLGYRNRFATSWVNSLSVRERNHAFVIGIGGEILSLGYRHAATASPRTISSIY